MEKETLIQNLKSRIGEADFGTLSERTIDSIIVPLLPQFADDEKVTEESYTFPVTLLKSFVGQYRHDLAEGIKGAKGTWENEQKTAREKAVSEAVEAFKTQWEKEHPATKPKDGNGGGEEKKEDKDTVDIDAKVQEALDKALQSLTGEDGVIGKLNSNVEKFLLKQEEREKAATSAEKRSSLLAYLKGLDGLDEDDIVIENVMLKIDFGTDETIDDLRHKAKPLYEKAFKKNITDRGGAQPFTGGAGGNAGGSSDAEFKKFLEEQKKIAEEAAKSSEALRSKMV